MLGKPIIMCIVSISGATTYLGERLRDLRERAGLSQRELAQRAGIAPSTLSEIESGAYIPNLRVTVALAEALGVPLESLLRPQPSSLQAILRTIETPANVGALQQWAERCYRYAQIEQLAGIATDQAPTYRCPDRVEEVEHIAEQERHRLRLGSAPIVDLVGIVESAGLRVVGADVGEDDIDGALFVTEEPGAFALINRAKPPVRQRFTLAHEYAHFLMHRHRAAHVDRQLLDDQSHMEKSANAFAAAFLMPREDIEAQLRLFTGGARRRKPLPLYAWIALRRRYLVSMSALGWRLYDLGWVSAEERQWANDAWDSLRQFEEIFFGNILAPEPVPAFTDRAITLLLHAFARGEVTATFTAESLQRPLAVILDYLQVIQRPPLQATALWQQLRSQGDNSALDRTPPAVDR